ncbi:hypothetical protein BT63DRAFT_428879 [Microthyrium microscopicum]|uniref:Uncharacterized protein n=1 Tax=Microthyrium microscopicum TaxID=703497 RepID=A0A6A6TZT2_9PEZI|nr:hypothetical protein BT63DRAFT_428879 [Microthyrium microscopicum]
MLEAMKVHYNARAYEANNTNQVTGMNLVTRRQFPDECQMWFREPGFHLGIVENFKFRLHKQPAAPWPQIDTIVKEELDSILLCIIGRVLQTLHMTVNWLAKFRHLVIKIPSHDYPYEPDSLEIQNYIKRVCDAANPWAEFATETVTLEFKNCNVTWNVDYKVIKSNGWWESSAY